MKIFEMPQYLFNKKVISLPIIVTFIALLLFCGCSLTSDNSLSASNGEAMWVDLDESPYARNSNDIKKYYRKNDAIYHSDLGNNTKVGGASPQSLNPDPDTFQIHKKYPQYSRDEQNIYYSNNSSSWVLENIDVNTFVVMNDNYFKDKDHIGFIFSSYQPKIITAQDMDIDIANFQIANQYWGHDGKKVFLLAPNDFRSNFLPILESVNGADFQSFQIIEVGGASEEPVDIMGRDHMFSKDNKTVFYGTKVINGADPDSFEVINAEYQLYSRDTKHVFYKDQLVEGADPDSLEVIQLFAARDNIHVYNEGHIFEGEEGEIPMPAIGMESIPD